MNLETWQCRAVLCVRSMTAIYVGMYVSQESREREMYDLLKYTCINYVVFMVPVPKEILLDLDTCFASSS